MMRPILNLMVRIDRTRLGGRTVSLWCCLVLLIACFLMPTPNSLGVTHLHRQASAPEFELEELYGEKISLEGLRDQVVILVFGELYHGNTIKACAQIEGILEDPRLKNAPIVPLLVVTQNTDREALRQLAKEKNVACKVLHDTKREVYESYRVAVLPSVVVIDQKGRVVHTVASLHTRLDDLVTGALLLTLDRISKEQFEKVVNPEVVSAGTTDEQRAYRLSQMAKQLVRRHSPEMAIEKYQEALDLDPLLTSAHIGLGTLRLSQNQLTKAEGHFSSALELESQSIEASIGLAYVLTLRGFEELERAEDLLLAALSREPNHGRAHYLLGLIHDQRGDLAKAVTSYKKAAEILMSESSQGVTP